MVNCGQTGVAISGDLGDRFNAWAETEMGSVAPTRLNEAHFPLDVNLSGRQRLPAGDP